MGGYGTSWRTVPRAVCTYKQVAWPSPKGREKESKNPREKSYSSCVARSRRCRQKKGSKKKRKHREQNARERAEILEPLQKSARVRAISREFPRSLALSFSEKLHAVAAAAAGLFWWRCSSAESRSRPRRRVFFFFFFWRRFPFGIRVLIFTFKLSVNNILS